MMLSFIFFVGLVFFSIPALLNFLIFVLMVLKIGPWRLKANIERSLSLPPGPWKLPIIGNLHHLVGSLPHHRLRNLANNYGPIMYLQIGEHPTILVSSPQSAKGVMQTHDEFFATRVETVATKIMTYDFSAVSFAPYGEQWIELRKLCTMELSSKKRDQSFRYDREEEVSEVIRSIASKAGSVTNLSDIIVKEFAVAAAGSNTADLFPSIKFLQLIAGVKSQVEKIHQQADKIISNIIEERETRLKTGKSEEDGDLVDVLLRDQENGNLQFPMTIKTIKAVIFVIIFSLHLNLMLQSISLPIRKLKIR
ncbi:putative cytochrome P450 superfamily protein [Citrus sinensis]|uniref:Cytochrome P450 superfamily protein n=1 Tax=Citrus sinensis TaxID=2711 RepID=A0ACB8MVT3_CITSI|nr:putative cytochrome P450 superfamily protein [Citrus sinensis]KAH9789681.1 putative cytochrome P450 superfamily protein [Citrus sinensis]